jgi:hypothetical protein
LSNASTAAPTVQLSGTGGSLPQGAAGPNGATGATGATGSRGPAGKIELVTCKPVRKTKRQKCTTKLVSGSVKFTTAKARATARISRRGVLLASGYSVSTVPGRWKLLLAPTRNLKPGWDTLTLRTRHGHHWNTRRRLIWLD